MFGVNIEEIVDQLTNRIEKLERLKKCLNSQDLLLDGKIQSLEEFRAWLSVEYL